jgi:hypothetical protein
MMSNRHPVDRIADIKAEDHATRLTSRSRAQSWRNPWLPRFGEPYVEPRITTGVPSVRGETLSFGQRNP